MLDLIEPPSVIHLVMQVDGLEYYSPEELLTRLEFDVTPESVGALNDFMTPYSLTLPCKSPDQLHLSDGGEKLYWGDCENLFEVLEGFNYG